MKKIMAIFKSFIAKVEQMLSMQKPFKLVSLLADLDFDYKINPDGTLSLIDLQGANLGNIEGDNFKIDKNIALYLIDRLETYIYDYFISGYINTLIEECNENVESECWIDILNLMKKYPEKFGDCINFMEAILNPEKFDITEIIKN